MVFFLKILFTTYTKKKTPKEGYTVIKKFRAPKSQDKQGKQMSLQMVKLRHAKNSLFDILSPLTEFLQLYFYGTCGKEMTKLKQ